MKFKSTAILALLVTASVVTIGCSATTSPTSFERLVYEVHTNYVEVPVIKVVTITNETGDVSQSTTTQIVSVPEYGTTLKPSVQAGIQTGGQLVNTQLPGVGSIISMLVLAVLGGWSHVRGLKSTATSTTLAQEVEAIREFIKSLPDGAKHDEAVVNWLRMHQIEAGVATQILDILSKKVNNDSAVIAAREIGDAVKIITK